MSDNLTLEEKQFANVEASLTPGRPLPYPEVGFPTSEEKEKPKWYSREAGLERTRRLGETLSYYTPHELQSALGIVDVLNPISALEDAGTQTQVALDSSRPKEERLEALTEAATNLGLAVIPAGLASRGYMRAAPAVMESLVGVSPSGTSDIVEEVPEGLAKPRRESRRPSVKPLFREAELTEQRALRPDEGQRVAEFYSPTEELLKDLPIPTNGIRGADILKAIEKEPTIRRQEVAAFNLDIDPQRRYTAEEVGQLVTRNPYRVVAQRPTEFDYTGRYTFQDTQRLELKPNEVQDISYDETIIRAIPAENKAGFVAAMGTHHTPDTIAHVRSSVKNVPSISDRDIYLIEEIQSDLVARGAKPVRGEITYIEALETSAKDTIGSLKEAFKDLPSAEIETNSEFLTDLYKYFVTRTVPERLKELPTSFNPREVMVEKYGVDTMNLAVSYLEKRNVPSKIAARLVRSLINPAVDFAYTPPEDLTKAIGPAPIKDINEVARLGLQTAIADALSNGQTKLVIPNLEQIVASGRARPGSTDWDNMTKPGSSFHRMYVTGMQKAIDQIKKDLPDISVDTKVEFPFQPRAYYVPSVKDPIDLDNTVTILDLSAYEGKDLSRLRFADGGMVTTGSEKDIKENLDISIHKRFAKGGLSMDNEMEMLMLDGGLRDDGMDTDPISGNEVPYGSLAEEVRDDIPAQLSEGEYVVPADVVRFFGVKYFEDLRKYAKMSLEEMEMNGRIGGEPVMNKGGFPSKEQTRGMQAGGVSTSMESLEKYRTFDPSKFVTPGQSYIKRAAELQGNTSVNVTPEITYVEYVSADGTNTLVVPIINGEPQVQIPEGYVTLEEFNKTEAQDSTQISKVDVRGNKVDGPEASEIKEAGTRGWESDTDFGNFTNEDWLKWSDEQGNNFLSTGILSGGIIGTVSQLDSVADMRSGIAIASMYGAAPETINEMKSKLSNYESRLSGFEKRIDQSPLIPTSGYKQVINHFKAKGINLSDKEINTIKTLMEDGSFSDSDLKQIRILGGTRADVGGGLTEDQFDSPEEFKQSMKDVAPDGMDYNEETGSYTRKDQSSIFNAAKDAGYTETITNEGVRVFENTGNVTPTSSVVRPVSRPTTTPSTTTTTTTTPTSSVVRPVSRPTTTTTTTPTSSRTLSDVQREINKALEDSGGVWTSELNNLVKEREALGGYGGS